MTARARQALRRRVFVDTAAAEGHAHSVHGVMETAGAPR